MADFPSPLMADAAGYTHRGYTSRLCHDYVTVFTIFTHLFILIEYILRDLRCLAASCLTLDHDNLVTLNRLRDLRVTTKKQD